MNERIVRPVWGAKKKNGRIVKMITVPSESDIQVGDKVIIEKFIIDE